MPGDHIAERPGGVRAGFVDPDADVLDDRGVLRLSQSGTRVSNVMRPSLPSQRHWKKQNPKVS